METKNKPQNKDRKKILLILIGVFAGICVAVAIALAFLLNYNVSSPNQVQILKDNQTYFSVNSNNNYKGYRFVFENNGDKIVVNSSKNVIILEVIILEEDVTGFVPGQKYYVTACYLGETEGANSDYSKPVEWVYYYKLESPLISYDNKTNIISWNKIDSADYYMLYIKQPLNTISVKLTEIKYDLNLIDGGEKEIYVYAFSNNEYLEQSKVSNIVQTTFIKYFDEIVEGEYNLSNKTLTFVTLQKIDKIDVKVDSLQVAFLNTKLQSENDGVYIYSVILENFAISASTNIEIAPSTIDSYNIFNGNTTKVAVI